MPRYALLLAGLCMLSGAPVAAAPAESSDLAAPPLTATFETVQRAGTKRGTRSREKWILTREPGRVAYRFGQAAERRLDVWSRRAAELSLLRVFPGEKTAVEYSQGQLRALGNIRSWQQLSSLLPQHPAKLGLKATGTGTFQQRKTQRFEGEVDGARISVHWLEPEQLPASLMISNARSERTTTLQKLELGRAETDPEAEPKRYRHIDAADLGDLEHDPFVQRHSSLLHAPHPF